jgi:hypothetical protein
MPTSAKEVILDEELDKCLDKCFARSWKTILATSAQRIYTVQ